MGYLKVRISKSETRDLHRHLYELHIGRRLGRREVVHHINENIHDNRIENLELMTLAQHGRYHRSYHAAKLTPDVFYSVLGLKGRSRDVAKILGINERAVSRIRAGMPLSAAMAEF